MSRRNSSNVSWNRDVLDPAQPLPPPDGPPRVGPGPRSPRSELRAVVKADVEIPVDRTVLAQRALGRYSGPREGPVFVAIGGMHGNEPAGAHAALSVLAALEQSGMPLAGTFLALTGNRAALRQDVRFIDQDLNRGWREEDIVRLLAADPVTDTSEDRERRELIEVVGDLERRHSQPLVFLDLHTTSGPSSPFACASDTLRNRRVLWSFPIPVILGLEEALDGSVMGFLAHRGHVAVAVEGGQHVGTETQARLEAALWLWLVSSGGLRVEDVPGYEQHRERLKASARSLPRCVEVLYRHAVVAGDGFKMKDGWSTFDAITLDQPVARDASGPITAHVGGRILMPLYQSQGEDGFFLVRDVSPRRIVVSRWIRRLRFDILLPLLPGIRHDPLRLDHLLVPSDISDGWRRGLLRLFGFRHVERAGRDCAFSRRRPGWRGMAQPLEENGDNGGP